MHWRFLRNSSFTLFVLLISISVMSCFKIEMTPEDNQRKREVADLQGKDLRANWATQMQAATTRGKLSMTKTFMDSVVSSYIKYGEGVANQWRAASEAQGAEVTDVQMQKNITEWNETQQPMIQAYEDIVEYSYDEISRLPEIQENLTQLLSDFRNKYYEIYSAVFFPKGNVFEYASRMNEKRSEFIRLSDEIGDLIEHYL